MPVNVVLFCNGYGDSILSLPALRALDRAFDRDWHLICHPAVADMLFGELNAKLCKVDFQTVGSRKDFDEQAVLEVIPQCDRFVSLVPWHSENIDALVAAWQPGRTFGFQPKFDVVIPLDFSIHSSDMTFAMARTFDDSLQLEAFTAPPQLPVLALERASAMLASLPGDMTVLSLHADTLPEKMWPMDRFRHVVDRFLDRHEDCAALALGTTEFDWDGCEHGERILTGYGLPLDVAMALVAKSDVFLGVDSCLLHVADFFRVPGVGLFGATNPDEFGFLLGPHEHVTGADMAGITEEAVFQALERIWKLARGAQSVAGKDGEKITQEAMAD